MNKEKYRTKVFIIIFTIFVILGTSFNSVKATSEIKNIMTGINRFEDAWTNVEVNGIVAGMAIGQEELSNISDLLVNTLIVVGIIVVSIVGLILGIKFMIGSVEQKAQIKESIFPFIIGCVVIFGAFGIWKIVLTILNQLE